MTDLEIFAEWHEKSLAKHIITKNAQAGAIIEFAKYYHKKQLSICDVVLQSEQFCDKCDNGFIWDEIGWSAMPCECEKNKQN